MALKRRGNAALDKTIKKLPNNNDYYKSGVTSHQHSQHNFDVSAAFYECCCLGRSYMYHGKFFRAKIKFLSA